MLFAKFSNRLEGLFVKKSFSSTKGLLYLLYLCFFSMVCGCGPKDVSVKNSQVPVGEKILSMTQFREYVLGSFYRGPDLGYDESENNRLLSLSYERDFSFVTNILSKVKYDSKSGVLSFKLDLNNTFVGDKNLAKLKSLCADIEGGGDVWRRKTKSGGMEYLSFDKLKAIRENVNDCWRVDWLNRESSFFSISVDKKSTQESLQQQGVPLTYTTSHENRIHMVFSDEKNLAGRSFSVKIPIADLPVKPSDIGLKISGRLLYHPGTGRYSTYFHQYEEYSDHGVRHQDFVVHVEIHSIELWDLAVQKVISNLYENKKSFVQTAYGTLRLDKFALKEGSAIRITSEPGLHNVENPASGFDGPSFDLTENLDPFYKNTEYEYRRLVSTEYPGSGCPAGNEYILASGKSGHKLQNVSCTELKFIRKNLKFDGLNVTVDEPLIDDQCLFISKAYEKLKVRSANVIHFRNVDRDRVDMIKHHYLEVAASRRLMDEPEYVFCSATDFSGRTFTAYRVWSGDVNVTYLDPPLE